MAIENFDEVKTYFETNKDSEDVKGFLGGFNNIDVFKEKVNTDPTFKSFLDSEKDKHSSKALETWKTNNLQKLIDEAVTKANPQETPEQKQIRELTERLNKQEVESKRKDLTNKALKELTDKKIPTDLASFIVGNDEESTKANLDKLAAIFTQHDEAIRKEFATNNSYTPPKDNNKSLSGEDKIREQIRKSMGIKTK